MRKVIVSVVVRNKIAELESYLKDELKLSKEAARKRSDRMRHYLRNKTPPYNNIIITHHKTSFLY